MRALHVTRGSGPPAVPRPLGRRDLAEHRSRFQMLPPIKTTARRSPGPNAGPHLTVAGTRHAQRPSSPLPTLTPTVAGRGPPAFHHRSDDGHPFRGLGHPGPKPARFAYGQCA
jgi:hypothetical protein